MRAGTRGYVNYSRLQLAPFEFLSEAYGLCGPYKFRPTNTFIYGTHKPYASYGMFERSCNRFSDKP